MIKLSTGEMVNVTIKSARVVDVSTRHWQFAVGGGDLFLNAELLSTVDIQRVAPAEWPPQPSDVWEDATGTAWFAQPSPGLDSGVWMLGGGNANSAEDLLDARGPMTLAYRKGWTPAPAAEVDQADEPEEAEGRDAIIAGLRELADRLQANSDLPLPSTWDVGIDAGWAVREESWRLPTVEEEIERIRLWAAAFGVEHGERRVGDKIHHTARCVSGGLKVHMSCIVPADEDVAPPAGEAVATEVAAEVATAPDTLTVTLDNTDAAFTPTEPRRAPDFELGKTGDHFMAVGQKGGPGECGAECTCGVGFWGFDTLREAIALLDDHIANPDPRDAVDPFHVLPDGSSDNSVHSVPDADGDLIAPAGEA